MPEVVESQQTAIWSEDDLPAREGEPVAAVAEPQREPRFVPVNRNQLLLRMVDVEQLVEPDHVVRAIWEMVGRLDLKGFTADRKAVEGVAGRPSFHPHLLISLWLYAYSEGVGFAREVERRCQYHPAYQWLTGMGEVSYHTLSDFRVQYQEALDELFAQWLAALAEEGLITLQRVAHDGTKVKASASGASFHREATLRAHREAAQERVRLLADPQQEEGSPRTVAARKRAAREKVEKLQQALQEIQQVQAGESGKKKSERRVSETDPEARKMKQSDGGFAPSHNVQISTDAEHGLIVGVSVTQSGNDEGELLPALEEIQRQMGRPPEQVLVDGGFTTREAILGTAERGVDLIGSGMETDPEAVTRRL